MKGADEGLLKRLKLGKGFLGLKDLEYTNKSNCYEVPTIDDVELYKEVSQSFAVTITF